MSEVLTVEEAAARVKVSESTIYRALESGALVGYKPARQWRIEADDLMAWLRTNRPAPAAATLRRASRPAGERAGSLVALHQRSRRTA